MAAMKRTPIHEAVVRQGATIVEEAGWLVAGSFGEATGHVAPAALWDESHWSKLLIDGPDGARALGGIELPVGAGGRWAEATVYRLRGDQLILLLPPGPTDGLMADLLRAEQNGDLSVTDITHGRARLRLAGPASAAVLSHLCGLDFHPTQFPNRSARQTNVARTALLLIRDDLPGETPSAASSADIPSYILIGARSLGAYLWETLLDAGRAIGIRPLGSSEIAPAIALWESARERGASTL
jgi:heterotetrameric sarcosine oxidase gamma subunit